MKRPVLAVAVTACIAILAGCGGPSTGPEIDRIMAEARNDAAKELLRSRGAWEGNAAWARSEAELMKTSAEGVTVASR